MARFDIGVEATGAQYMIVKLLKGGDHEPVYERPGKFMTFKTGDDAAKEALRLTEREGVKHQPRILKDDRWRDRERTRTDGGDYLLLPWHKEAWWHELEPKWRDHYPHASVNNGALIAYTESPEKGAADIQTRIKPGKYLEKYFGGDKGELNQYLIRDLCAQFSAKFEDNVVLWAREAEDIIDVFTSGPSSCMSHPTTSYKTENHHPVEAYAAGDIAIAYMKREGRIVARCVTYPEKKTYNKIYGDGARLKPLLSKEGINKCEPPVGARLKKVKITTGAPDKKLYAYLCPHIDESLVVRDDGEYLIVAPHNKANDTAYISASGAAGITEWLGYECACCSKGVTQRSLRTVYMSNNKASMWCAECSKTSAIQCISSGNLVAKSCSSELSNDRWIWNRHLDQTFVCPGTKLRYLKNEGVVPRGSSEYYSMAWLKKSGEKCAKCQAYSMRQGECDGQACGYNTYMVSATQMYSNSLQSGSPLQVQIVSGSIIRR